MSERREQLYLFRPPALTAEGLMVTVSAPSSGDHAAGAARELERFFGLLREFYAHLGGAGLEIAQLRERRLDLPELSLADISGEIPVAEFVEVLRRWAALEKDQPPPDPWGGASTSAGS